MKMILAHCARGFNMYHTIEAIGSLAGLENVYFDTGAICEAGAIHACIKAFGSKRVMYGSDVRGDLSSATHLLLPPPPPPPLLLLLLLLLLRLLPLAGPGPAGKQICCYNQTLPNRVDVAD